MNRSEFVNKRRLLTEILGDRLQIIHRNEQGLPVGSHFMACGPVFGQEATLFRLASQLE